MIIKKILLFLLSAFILTGSVSAEGSSSADSQILVHLEGDGLEAPPDITANAAVVINLQREEVIYEKNSSKIIYPASAVKMMTAILTLEYIQDTSNGASLDNKVIISNYVVANTRGNNIDMKEGEVFTVKDLLNAMLLFGSNDACLALAEFVSGNVPDFVVKMNEKARELGCENTVYTNPHGMHTESMYTTALDVSKVALRASKIDTIMDITSATKYDIAATNKTAASRSLLNRNHFVSQAQQSYYYYEYARGINAGSTEEAGFCLSTVARQQTNLSYLCVIMGATSTRSETQNTDIINSFGDAKKLFEWAFTIYSYRPVIKQKEQISTVKIELAANKDEITLAAEEDIRLLLPQNVDIKKEIEQVIKIYEEDLFAPIEQGQVLGEISLIYKGENVGSTKLISMETVEPSNVLTALDRIKNIVTRPWFTASVIIFIVLFAGYIALNLIRRSRRERRRFY